ncbi:hypothetical protein Tco_0120913 [Tanacetum coccineum]
MLTFGGRGTSTHVLLSMRALYSSHIACFQLGSRMAWKGDLGIWEEVVTCKLYLGFAFTIPTLERVTIGCCEVGGGGGDVGVVCGDGVDRGVGGVGGGGGGDVGVVCGDGVDRGVGGVDCGVVKAPISAMIVRVPEKHRWCGTRGKFVRDVIVDRGRGEDIKCDKNISKVEEAIWIRYLYMARVGDRLLGKNHHLIGTLLQAQGQPPKFCQLYIVGTQNEVKNRKMIVRSGEGRADTKLTIIIPKIISDVKEVLDLLNPLVKSFRLPSPATIEDFISAEILDIDEDPELYVIVREHMMHDPCGIEHMSSPCMVEPTLLKQYQAHINVEWCNKYGVVKYLFKYINKGPNRISAGIYVNNESNGDDVVETNVDEIKAYLDCRYVFAYEVAWRILKFEIHYRTPSIERISFHMHDQQQVVYQDAANIDDVLQIPL